MSYVKDVLARKGTAVTTATKDETVYAAALRMNEGRIGAMCVVEGERVVGMFTERDILCRVVAVKRDPAITRIGDVMTTPVFTCSPDAKTSDCAALMSQRKIRHLPVVEGDEKGKLVGMISTGDLMAMDVADKQAHIDDLHHYLHGRV